MHFPPYKHSKSRHFFLDLINSNHNLLPCNHFFLKKWILKIMKFHLLPARNRVPAVTYAAPTSGWARELNLMILTHLGGRFSLAISISFMMKHALAYSDWEILANSECLIFAKRRSYLVFHKRPVHWELRKRLKTEFHICRTGIKVSKREYKKCSLRSPQDQLTPSKKVSAQLG